MDKSQEQFEAGKIAAEMAFEVRRAREMYPAFNSRHEGYAVLLEEVTELQAEIFKKRPTPEDMRKEAIQIGAMAIRFVQDCCEEVKHDRKRKLDRATEPISN